MPLGIVCHWLATKTLPRGGTVTYNAMEERLLQLGRWRAGKYTDRQIVDVYLNNARNLTRMAPVIGAHVKLFRVSSSLLPLADQVDRTLWDTPEVRDELAKAGQAFRAAGVRLTTHPGQFCVLSSPRPEVIQNAFNDLMTHAFMFDAMGMPRTPYAAINVHGGKSGAHERLIQSIVDLPDNVRKRLTLENDESAYDVPDLLEVHQRTGVPVVFDSHHHTFNTGELTMQEAYAAACATWPVGVRPLQHISNTTPGLEGGNFMDRRKHSDYIQSVPDVQLEGLVADTLDLEVECKMKNLAVARLRADLHARHGWSEKL